jgi:hypothetical protein
MIAIELKEEKALVERLQNISRGQRGRRFQWHLKPFRKVSTLYDEGKHMALSPHTYDCVEVMQRFSWLSPPDPDCHDVLDSHQMRSQH